MGDEYTLQPEARGGRNRGATKKKAEPAEQIRTAVRRLWASASEEEIDELVADWLSELPAEAAPKEIYPIGCGTNSLVRMSSRLIIELRIL